ncbi:phosphotransferase family protein [Frankia gtarii]|uniref:phosphotransferase family protein n=1 Tax=Frankia gtarii TaxID=2950102 RepID=UPI0021BF9DA1|nr:phosphotransferase family protein [Frankia gtarii]
MTDVDPRFRPPEATVAQPWDRLAAELARHGLRLDTDVAPRQFAGGLANLNYLVSVDGSPTVLRRPPPGPSAEGANDMAREWRVLRRLGAGYPLAPRGVHFCTDPGVLGAQFQLLEYRDGVTVGATVPPALTAAASPSPGPAGRPGSPGSSGSSGSSGTGTVPGRLTATLLTAMAALHALDPASVGLGELGRPEGFLERQVEGWARRVAAVYPDGLPAAATAVIGWLRHAVADVPAGEARLIHCDFKFDNMLVDPVTLAPVAVLDWDMTTRGDPLFDLAVLLSYWIESDDPPALHELRQVPSLEPGFPRREQVAAAYFTAAGRPPAELGFHLALARLRLAIAWMQLYRRFADDPVAGPRYAGFARIADAVLGWTADLTAART